MILTMRQGLRERKIRNGKGRKKKKKNENTNVTKAKKHTVGTETKRLGRWKLAKQKREQRVTKNTKRKG